MGVNYPGLPADVAVGATVLVDSGLIRLEVVEKDETHVALSGRHAGQARFAAAHQPARRRGQPSRRSLRKTIATFASGSRRGSISSRCRSSAPAKTSWCCGRCWSDLGSEPASSRKSKIRAALRNLHDIVKVADAVMVARGDLGIEIDYHTLPLVQTRIVDLCLDEGKPVIIATHLLESMISAPMPTRAEISDISTAVRERADAVMLSGETTTGLYPLECVEVMKNIVKTIEPTEKRADQRGDRASTSPRPRCCARRRCSRRSWATRASSCSRAAGSWPTRWPRLRAVGVPIYAFTDDEALFRQLLLAVGRRAVPHAVQRRSRRRPFRTRWRTSSGASGANGHLAGVITNALARGKVIETMQLRQID